MSKIRLRGVYLGGNDVDSADVCFDLNGADLIAAPPVDLVKLLHAAFTAGEAWSCCDDGAISFEDFIRSVGLHADQIETKGGGL